MIYSKKQESSKFFNTLKNLSSLNHLDIELTERCNNTCIHCYINQPQNSETHQILEMETGFIKDVLQQAAKLGCLSVRFTGGEPLLREDFTELYLFARRLGLRVKISTNAKLITNDLCKLFENIPPGYPLDVTVYGMHSCSYDAIVARQGAYNEFQEGISLLKEHKIPFVVKQSLLPQNQGEISEFETFAGTLPDMNQKPSYSMNFELRARRDNPKKNQLIKRLRYSPEGTLKLLTRDSEQFVNYMRVFIKNHLSPPGDQLFTCKAGLGSICLDAYGNAQMCMLLRHPGTIYNLDPENHNSRNSDPKFSPLEYALKVLFPKIRQATSSNPEYLKRCGICFLRGLCDQCPAKSWMEHGTLDTPVDYFCSITHEKARYVGILKDGERAWEAADWQQRLDNFINEK